MSTGVTAALRSDRSCFQGRDLEVRGLCSDSQGQPWTLLDMEPLQPGGPSVSQPRPSVAVGGCGHGSWAF